MAWSLPAGNAASHTAGDKKSGYVYAEPQTRAMQDDDFTNPGFLWVDKGKALWSKVDGTAGKSCAACHGADAAAMRGVAAKYPKYDRKAGKLVDIEQRINLERVEKMGAAPLEWESDGLLGLTAFVKLQSRGQPVAVATDGPARQFWLKGKTYYETRRGQLDLACAACHIANHDRKLRSETLSQGQSNGFPTYRLSWETLGSVHRRFRECNSQIRAEPEPYGSDDYVNLELYVASRGQGLPVESPSVRK
ncbi:MAG: sulfur oxidation c-type cytochrome SoxA [Candidatus Eremiobacteraeota bacterium]|nr:sulfur oxidation c-type cytochrome SoxA [Candidatus Eremiobacteraeota bacterium]